MRRRAPFLVVVLAFAAIILSAASALEAHDSPIDHVERIVQVYIEGGKVQVVYRFRCDERQVMLQLNQMDADRDGKISDDERESYFKTVAADLAAALHLEIDGKPLKLASSGEVKLAPDLSQTYLLTAPIDELTAGDHTGKFSDDFSRTHPGSYRWSPRQINGNGIDIDAVRPPSTGPAGQHEAMISIDLKIRVRMPEAKQKP